MRGPAIGGGGGYLNDDKMKCRDGWTRQRVAGRETTKARENQIKGPRLQSMS